MFDFCFMSIEKICEHENACGNVCNDEKRQKKGKKRKKKEEIRLTN